MKSKTKFVLGTLPIVVAALIPAVVYATQCLTCTTIAWSGATAGVTHCAAACCDQDPIECSRNVWNPPQPACVVTSPYGGHCNYVNPTVNVDYQLLVGHCDWRFGYGLCTDLTLTVESNQVHYSCQQVDWQCGHP
jgi:hypothetical protein